MAISLVGPLPVTPTVSFFHLLLVGTRDTAEHRHPDTLQSTDTQRHCRAQTPRDPETLQRTDTQRHCSEQTPRDTAAHRHTDTLLHTDTQTHGSTPASKEKTANAHCTTILNKEIRADR